jgi:hypothetical protein
MRTFMLNRPLTLFAFVLLAAGCTKPRVYTPPPQEQYPYRPTEHGGVSYEQYPEQQQGQPQRYDQNGYPISQPQQTYGGLGTPPPDTGTGTGTGEPQQPQQIPDAPAIPGSRVEATGVAPIAKGDVVRAREQALAAAVRVAVEKSAGIIAPGTSASTMGEVLSKSRRFVPRYSIIHESSEPDVSYTVDIDAEVNVDDLKYAIANPEGGGGGVHTVEVWVANIRRAKDLKAVAALLKRQSFVRDVRQQSYKQQRAVLEADTTATAQDISSSLGEFIADDGVTLTIDSVTDAAVKTTLKLPPKEP